MRDAGLSEAWLEEQICANPAILNSHLRSTDLQVFRRQRRQSSGGRLDVQLRDEDSGTMYALELMLGATDESHIIRCIEYWDEERKRWPNRAHVAVLIAERITSRFYNVMTLLSHAVPMIGIQANLVGINGQEALHFTTIVDSYVEPEQEEDPSPVITKESWRRDHPEHAPIVDVLTGLAAAHASIESETYHLTYVAIGFRGQHRMWIGIRKGGRAKLEFLVPKEVQTEVLPLLEGAGISLKRSDRYLWWTTDLAAIMSQKATYQTFLERIIPSA